MKPGDKYMCTKDYSYIFADAIFMKGNTYTISTTGLNSLGYKITYFKDVNIQVWESEMSEYFKRKFYYGK